MAARSPSREEGTYCCVYQKAFLVGGGGHSPWWHRNRVSDIPRSGRKGSPYPRQSAYSCWNEDPFRRLRRHLPQGGRLFILSASGAFAVCEEDPFFPVLRFRILPRPEGFVKPPTLGFV